VVSLPNRRHLQIPNRRTWHGARISIQLDFRSKTSAIGTNNQCSSCSCCTNCSCTIATTATASTTSRKEVQGALLPQAFHTHRWLLPPLVPYQRLLNRLSQSKLNQIHGAPWLQILRYNLIIHLWEIWGNVHRWITRTFIQELHNLAENNFTKDVPKQALQSGNWSPRSEICH